MIRVCNLCKKYGKVTVIKNISFSVEDEEIVAITGESGKGKTTLLNLISLLDTEYQGKVEIDGKTNFSKKEIRNMQRYKIAYLFQNYALVENETVEQNLKIALYFRKNVDKKRSIRKALKLVGLEGFEQRKIYELSGGEQQRVALARAYLKKPQYIFADEPTGNLDKNNRDIVFSILRRMNAEGITVVFVTHDMQLAQQADKIIKV
jgi:putative ABC transport system ATP-binding protein